MEFGRNLVQKRTVLKLPFFFLFFLLGILLLSTFVYAAGGGGGSSSSGSSGGGSSSGSSGSDGPHLDRIKCTDRGLIQFDQSPRIMPVVLGYEDGSNLTVAGTWDGTFFTSEEAELVKLGTYTIYDSKNGNKAVECPGLVFSCRMVDITLQSCTQNDKELVASFKLTNIPAAEVKIDLVTEGVYVNQWRTLTYQKDMKSTELKGAKITPQEDKSFQFTASNLPPILTIQVSHPECIGKYYVYSKMDCQQETTKDSGKDSNKESNKERGNGGNIKQGEWTSTPDSSKVSSGQQLKCGGYLDIKDRVKCRVRLDESQAKEYDNFFPEECRSWDDADACVTLYRSVQSCWEKQTSDTRVACLRAKVQLGDIASRKSSCQGDQFCLDAVRREVHTFIKLKLYNLEEAAEEFEEDGFITEDQLIGFVVKMEESKLAFNRAKSKAERRLVILQARQHWIALVKGAFP